MLFTTSALATGLVALAALAQPASASYIRWRHAGPDAPDTMRFLVNCNGSPDGSVPLNGHPFSLAGDYTKYCTADWQVVKDQLGQIKSSSNLCMDATLGECPTFLLRLACLMAETPASRPLSSALHRGR